MQHFPLCKAISREFLQKELEFCQEKLGAMLPRFQDCFPAANTEELVYPAEHENFEWTTSFFSGMLWLLYEHTGDPAYLPVLEKHLDSFYHRVEDPGYLDTHDLGFLYSLSCYPAVLLRKDRRAEGCFLKAAHALRRRYFPQAGIIQACCSTGCTPSRTTGAWMSAPSGGTTTTWKPCSACSTAAAAIGAKSWNYPYSNPPSAPGPMWSGPSSSCWSR